MIRVICDTPGRIFIKNTKSYTGYYGCDYCNIEGVYQFHRMTFCGYGELRTNESFSNKTQPEHHHDKSPFEDIEYLDMVKDFPLDSMHLLYEGIMSKLIDILRFGDYKLSSANLFECDNFLYSIRLFIPSEFSRLTRSINHSHLWKATEFRLFSLYLIPIIICKGLLIDTNLCKLFMNFHVISYILNSKFLLGKHYLYVANLALSFIQQCEFLFGAKFIVYNVHCLKHIIEHCKLLGTVHLVHLNLKILCDILKKLSVLLIIH